VIQVQENEQDGFTPARDSDHDVARRLIALFEEKK
jgi:hypothetical protein